MNPAASVGDPTFPNFKVVLCWAGPSGPLGNGRPNHAIKSLKAPATGVGPSALTERSLSNPHPVFCALTPTGSSSLATAAATDPRDCTPVPSLRHSWR